MTPAVGRRRGWPILKPLLKYSSDGPMPGAAYVEGARGATRSTTENTA